MGTYYGWTNPKLGSYYNPYYKLNWSLTEVPLQSIFTFPDKKTPEWGSMAHELTDPTMGFCYNPNLYALMWTYYSWCNPKLGSCYNPYLLFSVRMPQWWGFIAVELTPQWGCVTTWIYMPWWGPIAVELTPSWGPVTTHIYFFQWEWPNGGVLLQLM